MQCMDLGSIRAVELRNLPFCAGPAVRAARCNSSRRVWWRRGRKRWILSVPVKGSLRMDAGAVRAVEQRSKSLFSAGIAAVTGDFSAQDAVQLCDAAGRELGRGLCNYSAAEVDKIKVGPPAHSDLCCSGEPGLGSGFAAEVSCSVWSEKACFAAEVDILDVELAVAWLSAGRELEGFCHGAGVPGVRGDCAPGQHLPPAAAAQLPVRGKSECIGGSAGWRCSPKWAGGRGQHRTNQL